MSHTGISKLTGLVIDPSNGVSPVRIKFLPEPMRTCCQIQGANISEMRIKRQEFSYKKPPVKILPAKCGPFCPCLSIPIAGEYDRGGDESDEGGHREGNEACALLCLLCCGLDRCY